MTLDQSEHLRAGQQRAGWDDQDLWIASYALGCNLDKIQIAEILAGSRLGTADDYQLLTFAINEQLQTTHVLDAKPNSSRVAPVRNPSPRAIRPMTPTPQGSL